MWPLSSMAGEGRRPSAAGGRGVNPGVRVGVRGHGPFPPPQPRSHSLALRPTSACPEGPRRPGVPTRPHHRDPGVRAQLSPPWWGREVRLGCLGPPGGLQPPPFPTMPRGSPLFPPPPRYLNPVGAAQGGLVEPRRPGGGQPHFPPGGPRRLGSPSPHRWPRGDPGVRAQGGSRSPRRDPGVQAETTGLHGDPGIRAGVGVPPASPPPPPRDVTSCQLPLPPQPSASCRSPTGPAWGTGTPQGPPGNP